MFVPTFRRYYEDNKCMQTKSCPMVPFYSFHVSADVFIQDQDRRKVPHAKSLIFILQINQVYLEYFWLTLLFAFPFES